MQYSYAMLANVERQHATALQTSLQQYVLTLLRAHRVYVFCGTQVGHVLLS